MDRERATTQASGALKKILKGKGKHKGSFYFVSDADAGDALLTVTLDSLDEGGQKASTQGKALRKLIKNPLFAVGSVVFADGRVAFHPQEGTAKGNKQVLIKGLRKRLGAQDGLSLLKQAEVIIAEEGDAAPPPPSPEPKAPPQGEAPDEPEEERIDRGPELLALLQEAERRYFAAGEPEDVASWIQEADRLLQAGDADAGLALAEKEIEWRLVRAERAQGAQDEIREATGGDGVAFAKLALQWREARDAAAAEMARFQELVLTDEEILADPNYPQMARGIESLSALIPDFGGEMEDALNAITEASGPARDQARQAAAALLPGYQQRLDADERLKKVDETAFGAVAVYRSLADALNALRDHLSR